MAKSILITGGARSGKSRFAERLALGMAESAIYVATAQALDDEMVRRIAQHKARRGPEWQTVNAPFELRQALLDTDGGTPRLVDCLTLWLTNIMLDDRDWRSETDAVVAALPGLSAPVVFVTNEVGSGIVPENQLARTFRDAAGYVNQSIAAACDEVYLTVAGYPLRAKPNDLIP